MRRILQALLSLALLPALASTAPLPAPAPMVQTCRFEAEIIGTHTYPDGTTIQVPIGSIRVTTCSSPTDLVRRVEELTNNVRAQATAQALR